MVFRSRNRDRAMASMSAEKRELEEQRISAEYSKAREAQLANAGDMDEAAFEAAARKVVAGALCVQRAVADLKASTEDSE